MVTRFERHGHKLATRREFAHRMLRAVLLWVAITAAGLAIGMAGYAGFEGLSLVDAFENAAMILSGMGPVTELKNTSAKLFAGFYAILSGLIIIIASSFVLAPMFHRVLHSFHVESGSDDEDDDEGDETKEKRRKQ
jgi:hypothetical protein